MWEIKGKIHPFIHVEHALKAGGGVHPICHRGNHGKYIVLLQLFFGSATVNQVMSIPTDSCLLNVDIIDGFSMTSWCGTLWRVFTGWSDSWLIFFGMIVHLERHRLNFLCIAAITVLKPRLCTNPVPVLSLYYILNLYTTLLETCIYFYVI